MDCNAISGERSFAFHSVVRFVFLRKCSPRRAYLSKAPLTFPHASAHWDLIAFVAAVNGSELYKSRSPRKISAS
jgi:hypothetical protein